LKIFLINTTVPNRQKKAVYKECVFVNSALKIQCHTVPYCQNYTHTKRFFSDFAYWVVKEGVETSCFMCDRLTDSCLLLSAPLPSYDIFYTSFKCFIDVKISKTWL